MKIMNLSLETHDFDLIYLGSGINKRYNFRKNTAGHFFKPFYPKNGLFAYIISDNGIKNIIRHLFPIVITCGGLDTIVGNLVRKKLVKAHNVKQDLCSIDYTSPSNIYNFSNKRKKLHEMELL